MRSFFITALVLLGAGCVGSQSTPCGSQVCPPGFRCDSEHELCVQPSQLTSCVDQEDGTLCEVDGVGGYHCDLEVCIPGICGDGVDDSTEECDDGPANSDAIADACRQSCRLPRCGDGVVDPSNAEACDDGASNSSVTPDTCRVTCQVPRCGDGVIDVALGEICDDGNLAPGDGCGPTCFEESCGDGVVDLGEECDEGANNSVDPGAICRPGCVLAGCGDGILDADRGEQCDGSELGSDTCESLGYHPGTLSCLSTCRIDTFGCGGYCGDGILNGDESCDGSDLDAADCTAYDYYSGILTCQSNCEPSFGQCEGRCGDGVLDLEEACDYADFGVLSCVDYGYYTGHLTCSPDCQTIDPVVGCQRYCGDGEVNGTEECDGLDVRGLYCVDFYGFDAGRLSCSSDCRYTYQGCYSPGWSALPSGTSVTLIDVFGFGWDDIWIVGADGTILHGRGSNRWDPIPSGTTEHLRSVHGIGPDDLWVVGDNGTILHWDGSAWTPHASGSTESLASVFAISPTDVYAVGGTRTGTTTYSYTYEILHYDGFSWTTVDSGTNSLLAAVWASGPNNVYAGGGGDISSAGGGEYSLVRRFDGSTWSSVTVPTPNTIYGFWGTGPNDIHAACTYRTVLHYDGTWHSTTLAPANSYAHMRGVWGSSSDDVIFVGRYGTIFRYDGSSYTAEHSGTGAYLIGVWGASKNDIYAVGTAGKILHFGGKGPGWTTDSNVNIGMYGVWADSSTEAFAVASGGAVSRWNGSDWSAPAPSGASGLRSVWGVSPSNVWAAGATSNALWHFDGTGWSADPIYFYRPWRVWGRSASEIYAVGDNGRVTRYNGTSWSAMSVPGGDHLYGVWASGPNDVYVAGRNQVWRHDGTGWAATAVGMPMVYFRSMGGSGPDDVWVVGDYARVLHWDGTSWSQVVVPVSENLRDVWVAPEGDVFIVGDAGTLVWYDGVAWSPMAPPVDGNLQSIHGTSRNDFFVTYTDYTGGGGIVHFQGQLPGGDGGGLIISEYVEGTGLNKYTELYNASGSDLSLGGYSVRVYSNGSATPSSTIALNSVILPSGGTYVLANTGAVLVGATADQSSGLLSFNGNDAVELVDPDSNRVDLVGVIGDAAIFGADTGFIRNPGINTGITAPAWDPAQWTTEPLDSHLLGAHTP